MNDDKLSPIIVFTYRRKIDQLISSLLKNALASKSKLYIFSDGYKSDVDKKDVLDLRKSLTQITGFKKIYIKESSINCGLANSVINGVSSVIKKYGKVIVLEDDLIVSHNFLDYMNESLSFYKDQEKIWSISGYTPYLECLTTYNHDVFLSVRASSWGWATWLDRWEKIDWEIKDWHQFQKDEKNIQNFNLGGNDMYKMLQTQMLGNIDSWAIRWCYNQFKLNTYTIYPTKSKLINLGFDEKGTHNSDGQSRWDTSLSNDKVKLEYIVIDELILQCFAQKYNLQFKTKIGYFLKQHGGYSLAKKLMNIGKMLK